MESTTSKKATGYDKYVDWKIFSIPVILLFAILLMPTPSGSGIGEMLAPALMSPFLEDRLLVAYTAVWRFFLNYITILVGGTLLVRWIGADAAGVSTGTGAPARDSKE